MSHSSRHGLCVVALACLCVLMANGYDFPKEERDLGVLTKWTVPEYNQKTNTPADIGKETCSICQNGYSDADAPPQDTGVPVRLPCCGNLFHSRCLQQTFDIMGKGLSLTCPLCNHQYGVKVGGQPEDGTMTVNDERTRVSVYMNFPASGTRKREIKYFSVGKDWKGYQIKHQLQILFLRKNLFQIGYSQSRELDNVVIPQGSLHLKHLYGIRYASILRELKDAKAIKIGPQPDGTIEQCKSADGKWIESKFIFDRPSGTVTKTVVLPSTQLDTARKLVGAFTNKVLFFMGASVDSNEAVVSPFEFELPTDKSISRTASRTLLASREEYFHELNLQTVKGKHLKRDTHTSLSMTFPVHNDKMDNLKRLNVELTDVLKDKRLPVWSLHSLATCSAAVVHAPLLRRAPVVVAEDEPVEEEEEEAPVAAPRAPDVEERVSTEGLLTVRMVGGHKYTLDMALESGGEYHAILSKSNSNRYILIPLIINAFKTGKLFNSESVPVLFRTERVLTSDSECADTVTFLTSQGARAGRHSFGRAIFSTISNKGQPKANLIEWKKSNSASVMFEFHFLDGSKFVREIAEGSTRQEKELSRAERHLLRSAFEQQMLFRVDKKTGTIVSVVNLRAGSVELVAALNLLLEEEEVKE
eukprot:GILK01001678.1.p1 GENE.GILK01001678.1~~GILK01001678.1.p1  ORF type:complete len:643 (+),score=118.83 GILK01001678.1:42-1970(+)